MNRLVMQGLRPIETWLRCLHMGKPRSLLMISHAFRMKWSAGHCSIAACAGEVALEDTSNIRRSRETDIDDYNDSGFLAYLVSSKLSSPLTPFGMQRKLW